MLQKCENDLKTTKNRRKLTEKRQTLCKGWSVFIAVLACMCRGIPEVCIWWCGACKWGWCPCICNWLWIGPCRVGAEVGISSHLFIVFARSVSFFFFILRFWNQTLTCRSVRANLWLISHLLLRVMYAFIANSFSKCIVCTRVYGFRFLRVRVSPPFKPFKAKNKQKIQKIYRK